ncbi:phosphoglycolate phosphatase [Xinfangfangia sp. CPCC 101601]|uniref:Phosphoglycolate phosphatase n=1 Tax=Pseudogemmobacter lacusdianii TaxID=3069608 RepID=A0ABU0VUD5_9RHOB|nr:phosphoglycolate phosphatase [Xinfangfangia sp. CPCC 101601]MDQ2065345.1 phosphoglycolate phosphatase [Xinfangfangia sp. CPCC 101601]
MILIFDLDGTLIDSAPDIAAAVNQVLHEEGLAPLDLPTVTGFVGNGLPKLVERVMAACALPSARHQELTARVLRQYEAEPSARTRVYPGVVQALKDLQVAGHELALCTNKPEAPARAILQQLGLDSFFPVVIGGDTLSVNKPNPAPALAAQAQMGGGPAAFIGDSEVDAATAKAAAMPFYLFTEGYRKSPVDQLPHHAAFADFANLPSLIGQTEA